jgi:hypothetical protein
MATPTLLGLPAPSDSEIRDLVQKAGKGSLLSDIEKYLKDIGDES